MTCLSMNDADRAVDVIEGVLEEKNCKKTQRSNKQNDIFEQTLSWQDATEECLDEIASRLNEQDLSFHINRGTIFLTVPAPWSFEEMYTW